MEQCTASSLHGEQGGVATEQAAGAHLTLSLFLTTECGPVII